MRMQRSLPSSLASKRLVADVFEPCINGHRYARAHARVCVCCRVAALQGIWQTGGRKCRACCAACCRCEGVLGGSQQAQQQQQQLASWGQDHKPLVFHENMEPCRCPHSSHPTPIRMVAADAHVHVHTLTHTRTCPRRLLWSG